MTRAERTEPMTAGAPVKVDIVSDVVCPWCYVGKRRFAEAVGLLLDVTVSVRWRPFRLDPTIPPGGIARNDYLSRKFGSPDAAAPMYRQLTDLGAEEGIAFRFDRIERSPNTVDAHRLIRWAASTGAEDDVVERLFAAYFIDGEDIGAHDVLAAVADAAGLDAGRIVERLASDEDRAAVEAEVNEAYRIGVSGVPCFIIDQAYAVIGAHPAETIVAAIRQAVDQRAATEA